MKRSTTAVRALLATGAIACAVALSGCDTDGVSSQALSRAAKPLSPDLVSEIERRQMPATSPILVRIFKEEAELEVWKQDSTGRYALLKTYPICRWSGELGPKVREGDRQAPEGFYDITPGLMNPNSNYYLAFNLGFPNAYDKANDRNGAFLMVHGDCSSRGCYAMTDDQIGEIFALGRDSFMGGQKSFQVQAYPFRMTALNMARHRNSPNMPFWRMIKEGYDHFEVTRQEPKIDVCERRYVFDAAAPAGSDKPLNFNPRGRCPSYEIPQDVAAAVKEKQDKDEAEFADYVSRGLATVAVRTGTDGGMHPTFLAKLKPKGLLDGVFNRGDHVAGAQPGPLPPDVNPPHAQSEQDTTSSVAATNVAAYSTAADGTGDRQTGSASKSVQMASATPSSGSESMMDRMGKFFGLRNEQAPPPPVQTASAPPPAKPKPQPKLVQAATAPKPKQVADAQPPAPRPAQPAPAAAPAPAITVINGAAPPVAAGSFDNRWGGGLQ